MSEDSGTCSLENESMELVFSLGMLLDGTASEVGVEEVEAVVSLIPSENDISVSELDVVGCRSAVSLVIPLEIELSVPEVGLERVEAVVVSLIVPLEKGLSLAESAEESEIGISLAGSLEKSNSELGVERIQVAVLLIVLLESPVSEIGVRTTEIADSLLTLMDDGTVVSELVVVLPVSDSTA